MNATLAHAVSALSLAVTLSVTAAAQAGEVRVKGGPCAKDEPGRGGWVDEHGPRGSQYDLYLTDYLGKRLNPQPAGYPQRLIGDARGNASFNVPTGMKGVCDAENDTILPPAGGAGGVGGGARAVLKLESIFFDRLTGQYLLQNIFDTLQFLLGDGVHVIVPDLYGDTNNDGLINGDDTLYSVVDLDAYALAPQPVFAFGSAYTVVNGLVAELPFIQFSTTPFVFDSASGFTGTPYSGRAVAVTSHDLLVPEPGTLALVAAALSLLPLARRRARQK